MIDLRLLEIYGKSKITCPINKIIRLEAENNYCRIITTNKKYYEVKTLKSFEAVLSAYNVRMHSKHIVNSFLIKKISSETILMINDECVVMSRRNKSILKNISPNLPYMSDKYHVFIENLILKYTHIEFFIY